MRGIKKMITKEGKRVLVSFLCMAILLSDFVGILSFVQPEVVEAAQVTIDSAVSTTVGEHLHAGSQTVFTSDLVGYKFYVDSTGECAYSKTSDGGVVWDAAIVVDSQTDCDSIAVWYDRWTPNDFGNTIHIVTMDTSSNNDNLFYNALDTTTDTRLLGAAATNTDLGNIQTYTLVAGANAPSITKGTNGTLYIAIDDATDSAVLRCTSSCGTPGSWSEAGTRPQDLANDYSILMPLVNGDIMIINRDISLEDIRSKIWNGSVWSASWTIIDQNATDNLTYDIGLAATLASSTVAATTTIFLAYTADNATPGTDDDIRTARFSAHAWATSTTANPTAYVVTNDAKGITNVSIARDQNTGFIYVAYNAQSTANTASTGQTYWKMSTTSLMNSWTFEVGPVNTTADDLYGVDLNMMSNQRIYVSWYGATPDDIFGDTIADLVPGVSVSTTSAQVAWAVASTSSFYPGGAFVFTESISSRNVTSITIEEDGTVDAENALDNIKLLYENDTTYPYDCASVSYGGSETVFGSTTVGFNGANGSSTITGSATVSTTSALCIYPVMDILDSAQNGDTLHLLMGNPSARVVVSGGGEIGPSTAIIMTGITTIQNDILTQNRFHWRNDNGSEAAATSRTGGIEGTNLTALQQVTPVRLRVEVSNEGGTTSVPTAFRLEYSIATSTCSEAYLWTDVGASDDEWNMYNSSNLTDGADTTNIAVGIGGVTDENASFITSNAGVKDTSSQTAAITATTTQFVELEYSIIASTTAAEGNTYCFRVTNAGNPLPAYTLYARASIAADVAVTATSSQFATTSAPTANFYIGGAYVITENAGSRNVTDITITENDSIDASIGIDNIRLVYDLDTSFPYDCGSESYSGSELPFGVTDTDGFSSANGTSTFSDSIAINTTRTLCIYTVLDVTESAQNDETLNIVVSQPSTDVVVTGGGSVSPSATRDITGSTTIWSAVLTQSRYHWRDDNGSETGASSKTNKTEGTAVSSLYDGTPARLRLEISNEGATATPATVFRLEYAPKITTCSVAIGWTDVEDALGAWDMYDSPNLTNGANTTDIPVDMGGVTNDNPAFLTPNGGVRDTTSLSASVILSTTQFIELEYSIEQTADAGFSAPYCFRVVRNGLEVPAYTLYPELTTAPERDFKVQHGTSTISGDSVTLTAGLDYVAPAASTSAFMRITNSNYTGAGHDVAGGTLDADDVTAYISNPSNIMTSVTIMRPTGAANTTRVSWEIIEFVGKPGSDNEMVVWQQEAVTYGTTAADLYATATAAIGTINDDNAVVFITGQFNPDTTSADYNTGQSTASWASSTNQAVFERGEVGGHAVRTSFAVVEFVGQNWKVQRVEHTYSAAGSTETEDIPEAVNSTSRTFMHAQKRIGTNLPGTNEFGHEVWLSSVGQVSFLLQSGAGSPGSQTSVAWVVENIQTSTGAMTVWRSNYSSTGGAEPLAAYFDIGGTLSDVGNASIFLNNRAALTTAVYPRPILGVTITASTTQYEIWRNDTGSEVNFRTEVVEWPVAAAAIRQRDYQFYVDNNALDPTDVWPEGAAALGESTVLTGSDGPLGSGERIRVRMLLMVRNASLPESSQAFKLQYGERSVSCSALTPSEWFDLGDIGSTTALWRGYDAPGVSNGTALSGDPPTGGALNLGSSDVAGTYQEQNNTAVNPYRVEEDENIEYDWLIQQHLATASTTYCLRMVKSDGSALDSYLDYPQLKTAEFDPVSQNWQWYDDATNETPSVTLGGENVAPSDVVNGNEIKLRVSVFERENMTQTDTRFKLQFSEYSDFSTSSDVRATSSCTGNSFWCYVNTAVADNAVITTALLSDSDPCVAGVGDGCGTYTESTSTIVGFSHTGSTTREYEFALKPDGPHTNRTYYFRLYDTVSNTPVPLNTGESYPSIATEGAHLTLSSLGVTLGTSVEDVTTDITTTPTQVAYGVLTPNTPYESAQRFMVTTNATEGYQMLMYATMPFTSSIGTDISFIAASNTAPAAWNTACDPDARGCYGYHVGDDTLAGVSAARFAPTDTYAAFESAPREVAYSSIPVTNDTVDIVYRVLARDLQPAGLYETNIVFVTVPAF